LLCFIKPKLGNRYGPGVIHLQGTWGGRILTLHRNYVAGNAGPLLFLFERTHNYKRRENGENVNPISEHRLRGSQLGRAMNLVDRLRTSADERVLSGRRAVVIA